MLSLPCWRVCYWAGEALIASVHILGHLLWQSGLHHRSGFLQIRCLCKCPPWAWPRLYHPHAALGQMHLCCPHPNCLPGHGSPCSSADRPHGVSMACVSVGSTLENRHPQMRSQSVLFIVVGSKLLSTSSWRGDSGLPTDFLLVHVALQPLRVFLFPVSSPRTCVSNIWLEPLTPRAYLQPCISLIFWVLSHGHTSGLESSFSLHTLLPVDLILKVSLEIFLHFPISFLS